MSDARIIGHMPRPGEIIGVLDTYAKIAAVEARMIVKPLVEAEAPGGLGKAMTASVRPTATGYRIAVQSPAKKHYKSGEATIASVVRYVNRGTGIYRVGPGTKKKIEGKVGKRKLMRLPGGRDVRYVKGQRPNPFLARAETRATGPVAVALENGAHAAAAALRKL
jgi:hypothetical protein